MDCDTTSQALLYFTQLKSQRTHRQHSISVATKNKLDTTIEVTVVNVVVTESKPTFIDIR